MSYRPLQSTTVYRQQGLRSLPNWSSCQLPYSAQMGDAGLRVRARGRSLRPKVPPFRSPRWGRPQLKPQPQLTGELFRSILRSHRTHAADRARPSVLWPDKPRLPCARATTSCPRKRQRPPAPVSTVRELHRRRLISAPSKIQQKHCGDRQRRMVCTWTARNTLLEVHQRLRARSSYHPCTHLKIQAASHLPLHKRGTAVPNARERHRCKAEGLGKRPTRKRCVSI